MEKLLFALLSGSLFWGAMHAAPMITVYNQNFAVVRDSVPLQLQEGRNAVSYSGVTTGLEPESVILRDPQGEVALRVLEQSYRGDPVNQTRLLQLFEGKSIRFVKTMDGKEEVIEGKIVRAPVAAGRQGNALNPIIEVDGELMMSLPGQPLFPNLGDGSILQPTLSWDLYSDREVTLEAQLSYLSRGMSWKADYNLILPEQGDVVSMTGWVSIDNNTGKTFEEAKIKLMAGEVNKVMNADPFGGVMEAESRMAFAMAGEGAPEVTEKKFDEFHLYSLPLPTTLRDRETKQVEFIRAEGVQTKKLYVYDGGRARAWRRNQPHMNAHYANNVQPDVGVYREFVNEEENQLGLPLPAGRLRFYRMDEDGQLEFTGENTIEHTPKKETVRVFVGNAFDVVGERKRTKFYKHPSQDLMRESFEVEIRNRSEEAVTVDVVESLFRWSNWQIIKQEGDFVQEDSQTIIFDVKVAADSVKKISYTVEYTW